MSSKVRTLLVALFLTLSVGVAACADATGPVLQDVGTPSFDQTQDTET